MEEHLNLKQVANILQIESSTVRFWEKEFLEFLDQPNYKGQRKRFSQNNLETLVQIKELLQTEQYTIKGAKRRMEMDRTLTSALGIDSNFKTTVFFMFSSIIEELQAYRKESKELRYLVQSLQTEKTVIAEQLAEEQNKGILDFIKDRMQNKKTEKRAE